MPFTNPVTMSDPARQKQAAKLRATSYATTRRAIQLNSPWVMAMNDEDLVLQSNSRKKDEEQRKKLRIEQRRREEAAKELERIEKQKIRDEREARLRHQEELEREAASRRDLEQEERAQRSAEERDYGMQLMSRFPMPGRNLKDIRSLFLKYRRDRDLIEAALLEDRMKRIQAHVRWRYRAIETIWNALKSARLSEPSLDGLRVHLTDILKRDERYRRELMIWPRFHGEQSDQYKEELDEVPHDAETSFLDLQMRPGGERLIHLCCRESCGSEGALSILLGAGASPHVQNDRGITPVHVACQAGCRNSVAKLLAHGADGRAKINATGNTPMFIAIENGHFDIVKLLYVTLGRKALVDTNFCGITPLHLAAYFGHVQLVEQILCWLAYGRNVVVTDRIDWSRARGFYKVPGSLQGKANGIASGFFTAQAENRGLRVGSVSWKDRKSICGQKKCPEITAQSKRGVTPLMCAAWTRNTEIMCMLSLFMTKDEIALKDSQGNQAKDYARCGHKSIDDRKADNPKMSSVGKDWILDPLL